METLIAGQVTTSAAAPQADVASMAERHVDDAPAGCATLDAIAVRGLTKRYRGRVAVDDLSFTIPVGAVAGLVGPNGAGKTTLMAMLLGLIRPSEGSATVLDHPILRPAAYLGKVGASIESPAFHPAVSGADNLRALAVLGSYDEAQVSGLIERVGLSGRGDDRFGSYSLGMKQRLAIATALLGDPQLVILDEPTNGLDPLGMQEVRGLIAEIAAEGRTVLVSSHLLSELDQVCDWLIVIDHGGLVYAGHPDDLAMTESIVARPADAAHLRTLSTVAASVGLATRVERDAVVVGLDGVTDPAVVAGQLNHEAHVAGINLVELHHERGDLEARYLDVLARHSSNTPATQKAVTS